MGLKGAVGSDVARHYAGTAHVNFATVARAMVAAGEASYEGLRRQAARSDALARHGMEYAPETGALIFDGEPVAASASEYLAWLPTGPGVVGQEAARSELRDLGDVWEWVQGLFPKKKRVSKIS